MKGILTFTNLFPSAILPQHGLFVRERMARVVDALGCPWRVVAPRPRVPRTLRWLAPNPFATMPPAETVDDVTVEHPAYLHIPGLSLHAQARRMARASLPVVRAVTAAGTWILDAHYLYPDGVAAAEIARQLSLPYVLTARGSDLNVLAQRPKIAEQIRTAAADAQALFAVSADLGTRFAELCGIDTEQVEVVRNGVDLKRFHPGDRSPARRILGLPPTGKLILGVGRLIAAKGFLLAARALERLPGTALVLVGEGPERLRIEAAAPPGRCFFLGSLRPDLVAHAYRACDVLALPSQREGWPNVINESLASGLPVVATAVGGIPEILTDPAVGGLTPPGDEDALASALRRFLDQPPAAHTVREFAQRFSWDEPVARLVERLR